MKRISFFCAILLFLGVNPPSTAAPAPVSGREAFALLKGLAGEWHGTSSESGQGLEATVLYRVTSAGSVVLETLFPGTDHEMLTVYHLDGDKLVLTHYCAAGNQPQMRLDPRSTAVDLAFAFAGGSNVNPKKDAHMHAVRIHLENADSIRGEWIGYQDGKQTEATKFFLARKK